MALSQRHGFTFHLYFDPEGLLWFEVHRDRDGAVVEFGTVDDTGVTLDGVIDQWITSQLEDQFSHIDVKPCRSCQLPCQQPRCDEDGIDARDELAWRFDLCPTCADRLRIQNPWLSEYYTPSEDENEDW
ncbi:MAG: hypothetical protein RI900_1274 [Actinomycetota bacterium]|jgi:hypothetical protein